MTTNTGIPSTVAMVRRKTTQQTASDTTSITSGTNRKSNNDINSMNNNCTDFYYYQSFNRNDHNNNNNDDEQKKNQAMKIMNKRRRIVMLQQMKQNSKKEYQQHLLIHHIHKHVVSTTMTYTLYILGCMIFFIILPGLYYIRPTIIFGHTNRNNRMNLPNRNFITLYPIHIKMKQNLPRVVMNYARATLNNTLERAALRHVATVRTMATYTSNYNQKLYYTGWEINDFYNQIINTIPSDTVDQYCGIGFTKLYKQQLFYVTKQQTHHHHHHHHHQQQQQQQQYSNTFQNRILYDWIYYCSISIGHFDGYIKWNVTIESELTRGTNGVAIQYFNNPERIHTDMILLPILSRSDIQKLEQYYYQVQKLQRRHHPKSLFFNTTTTNTTRSSTTTTGSNTIPQRPDIPPSTTVPNEMMKWFVRESILIPTEEMYVQRMEEYLFQLISNEVQKQHEREQQQAQQAQLQLLQDDGKNESQQKDHISSSSSSSHWDFLYAACTISDRAMYDKQYRRVGSNCPKTSSSSPNNSDIDSIKSIKSSSSNIYGNGNGMNNFTSNYDNNITNSIVQEKEYHQQQQRRSLFSEYKNSANKQNQQQQQQQHQQQQSSLQESCCSFYDIQLKPFLRTSVSVSAAAIKKYQEMNHPTLP